MTLGLPVGAVINCADNTGAKNLYVISVTRTGARLNKLPAACVFCSRFVTSSCRRHVHCFRQEGKARAPQEGYLGGCASSHSLVMPAVVVRQRKSWRRKNGVYLYFEGSIAFDRFIT